MATEWHSKQFVFCSGQPYPQPNIRNLIWAKSSKHQAKKCTFAGPSHAPMSAGLSGWYSNIAVLIIKAHEYCLIYRTKNLWCSLPTFSTEMIQNLVLRNNYTFRFMKSTLHSCWVSTGLVLYNLSVSYYNETLPPRWESHLHHADGH
jgi:hypothetical protein